ncbi:MAG: hypothetical protein ACRC2U_03545, partial [Aeromonas sp.]
LRGKEIKLAELLQQPPIANPGCKHLAEGIHVGIELSQLFKREPIQLSNQVRRFISKCYRQMMVRLVLPPTPVASEQLIQLLKTLH